MSVLSRPGPGKRGSHYRTVRGRDNARVRVRVVVKIGIMLGLGLGLL